MSMKGRMALMTRSGRRPDHRRGRRAHPRGRRPGLRAADLGGEWGGYGRYPPRWPAASDFDGGFIYCRGHYTSRWREQSGSGWNTDYPGADNNFRSASRS